MLRPSGRGPSTSPFALALNESSRNLSVLSFAMIVGVSALELLVCAIQAYVFALLTSLYLHDAVHLH